MSSDLMWIDNHCHITMLDTEAGAVESALAAGVIGMISVGVDEASSTEALQLAARSDRVWATAGLHPHDALVGVGWLRGFLESHCGELSQLVAVGECGLDYHYDHSPRSVQRSVFAQQIQLANEFGLPLVVHTRDAWADTLSILDSESMPTRTVIHCFTGGPAEAEACLERGALLSFSGIVTFARADDVREAAALTPIEQLMVETDSPFLAPVPHRGKPNTPALVGLVGLAIAEIKGVDPSTVSSVTTATAIEFYGLDLGSDVTTELDRD